MSEGGGDQDQEKTEEPSQRRLDDARQKGQVPTSKEVGSFLLLLSLTLIIVAMAPFLAEKTGANLVHFIESPDDIEISAGNVGSVLIKTTLDMLLILAIPFAATMIMAIAANFMQHGGFIVSADPMMPKFSKISPVAGLKRLFSMKSLVEFIKNLIKIFVIGYICYAVVMPKINHIEEIHEYSIIGILQYIAMLSDRILIAVTIAMGFVALFDLLYQRYDFTKSMRMTKQELKEEYKQTEGDPHIKGKLKQMRLEKSKKRMMAAVPSADVVITNPNHYSIALKYDARKMSAPIVVAKGIDSLALTIREIAKENKIPLVENPPLARALYSSIELDREVTAEYYKAVAEIISYVFKLKGKIA